MISISNVKVQPIQMAFDTKRTSSSDVCAGIVPTHSATDNKRRWCRGVWMCITQRCFALVQEYAPEIDKRCRPHLRPTNDSWRVDETYIKVKGKDKYLYRALKSAWGGEREGFTMELRTVKGKDGS